MLTLGSLFDGSGGFPLAGVINGITPLWSSEIEAYPLRVTAARFPDVKQLGDVTKIDGAKIDPVDIITFGSPCQDLSVAGKQKGIHDGERSNLFFEAVRIIKEMRDEDRANGRSGIHIRPRFAVWENVPGAFSSNQGNDFRAVLKALAGVCEDGLDIPRPKKWNHAGGVAGDGWSIAWRVYDAQYWGVPQRRRRIYLIADFAGERAGEILFERESVPGHFEPGREAQEGSASDAQGSAGGSGGIGCLNPRDGQARRLYAIGGLFPTLSTRDKSGQNQQGICYPATAFAWANSGEAGLAEIEDGAPPIKAARCGMPAVVYPDKARSLMARYDSSPCLDRGQNVVCYDARGNGNGKIVPTLTGDHSRRVSDYTALRVGNGQLSQISMAEQSNTLDCMHDQQAVLTPGKPPRKYIIRRLTPLECCRLQGFPDDWEDGVEGSDSARYKMWGNGIALPCAVDVLGRIAEEVQNHGD